MSQQQTIIDEAVEAALNAGADPKDDGYRPFDYERNVAEGREHDREMRDDDRRAGLD